ncbi:methyltransferase family protein [Mesorhizobium xinjiangense]|uniref:methyltransferase family protein n=1 Tax=Mesorhizobium xinjiangense TaxID=2678685 RepID=UPI0012EE247E|nr:isoprenylcysteine carboxylmethyltransferase family protein [Mesorhizobium xinjiangense]
MSQAEERPSRVPWPPIIYLAAIVIAVALSYTVPLPWLVEPTSDLLFAVGLVAIAGAIAIEVAAMRALKRAETTILPTRASAHLVTDGPFSFSRNPIYLGNTLFMIGIGLMAGAAWFIVLAVVAAFLTQKLAIEREEEHLATRFGKRYRDYRKRVRRWI